MGPDVPAGTVAVLTVDRRRLLAGAATFVLALLERGEHLVCWPTSGATHRRGFTATSLATSHCRLSGEHRLDTAKATTAAAARGG